MRRRAAARAQRAQPVRRARAAAVRRLRAARRARAAQGLHARRGGRDDDVDDVRHGAADRRRRRGRARSACCWRTSSPTSRCASRRARSPSTWPSTRSPWSPPASCSRCCPTSRAPAQFHFEPTDVPAILAAALTFFIVNTSLVAAVVAMVEGVGIWRYLVNDWFAEASTTGLMLGLSPIIVLAADYSLSLVALLFLPLYAIHRGGTAAIAKEHQAVHDALTGLPNRVLFRERVEEAIRGESCTVMLMDLNHFKEINDTLGHHQGDRLLQEVGARLRATLRDGDTVARLGGDEFGILLHGAVGQEHADAVAESLLARLREPFVVDATTLQVGGSIGLARHPEHGERRRDADPARRHRHVRRQGRLERPRDVRARPGPPQPAPARARRRAARRDRARRARARLPAEGRAAHGPDRRRRGARPLGAPRAGHGRPGRVRPDRRADRPDHRAHHVGARHRARARRRVARARPRPHDRRQPLRPLVPRRAPRARRSRSCSPRTTCRPACLELEITESMLMHDPERARETLERLAAIGVGLSVDDFGTGYSSLAHLKRLPVDTIKIDKSFVLDMDEDEADEAIVRSTIELAHNLGLRVVAEGVESAATWLRLAALGCDLAQGFHLARPLPADAVLALLESERRDPAAPCRHLTTRYGCAAMDDAQRLHTCSIGRAMDILGERWTLLILRESFYGVRRFSVMQRNLGIARNILSSRLQLLVRTGILERAPLPGGARALRVQADGEGPRPLSRRRGDHALGRRAPLRGGPAGRAAPPLRPPRRPRARLRALPRRARSARGHARARGGEGGRSGARRALSSSPEPTGGEHERAGHRPAAVGRRDGEGRRQLPRLGRARPRRRGAPARPGQGRRRARQRRPRAARRRRSPSASPPPPTRSPPARTTRSSPSTCSRPARARRRT